MVEQVCVYVRCTCRFLPRVSVGLVGCATSWLCPSLWRRPWCGASGITNVSNAFQNATRRVRVRATQTMPHTAPPQPPLSCSPQLAATTLGSEWDDYRLGDMVLQPGTWSNKEGRYFHLKHYPDSIVGRYIQAKGGYANLTLLHEIIANSTLPESTGCVVHIRLGDVIDKATASLDLMWTNLTTSHVCSQHSGANKSSSCITRQYVYPSSCFAQIMPVLRRERCRDVTLVTALHHTFRDTQTHMLGEAPRSCAYLERVRANFVSQGFGVALRLNHSPDDDVRFIYASRVLVKSGGGYSSLVARLVHMRGKTVIAVNNFGSRFMGVYAKRSNMVKCE